MKTTILSLLALCFSLAASAQCNPYYDLKEGMSWEMTSYDDKDRKEGRQVTTIKKFEEQGNGWKAIMSVKVYDKKDKLVYEQEELEFACDNGVITIDMEKYIPQESLQAFKDMNMDLEVDNLELPQNLEVGMTLDDGGVTLSSNFMTMTTTIENRKVESIETITTPAGTFECYKITYDMNMKMGMTRTMSGVEWITKDVGVVKSETYKSNGKSMGYSLLTNIE